MDKLGQRIEKDRAAINRKRRSADNYEETAKRLRREADEIERLLELARQEV